MILKLHALLHVQTNAINVKLQHHINCSSSVQYVATNPANHRLSVLCRAEAMLAEAVSIASAQSTSDRHIAAHQGKRRKKVAQDPVTRLEKDLLRASHGIEAQLYQDL